MRLFARASCVAFCASLGVAGAAGAQVVPNVNQYGPGLIGAPAAWAAGYTGAGITVTVADSGIDPTHPAFAGKIDPRSRSFVLDAPGTALNPAAINDPDPESHGTHVAGIVAASGTSQAPGIAFNAGLIVLKMIPGCAKGQDCSAPGIPNASASALDYFTAQAGTKIYNASYGPSLPAGSTILPASGIDPVEAASVQNALVAGKIIVAATGNDRGTSPIAGANPNGIALDPFIQTANANAGVYQNDGGNYDFSGLLNKPGIVVAVTSVGQAKTIAPHAQTCGVTASWCVAAPGGNTAVDAGIYSTFPGNKYGYLEGTSMAAPTVSGALADLQQAYPDYSGHDLAYVLFATAENVGGTLADNATYGYGLIRLDRAIAGPTTLAAGTAVGTPAQQVTYWSQPLTTAGAFSVTGPGYLIIAGRTTAAGNVAVTGGALGVDGTLTANGGVTVAQGAMLAGIGQVVGNTTVNGTLNAGQLPNYADVAANSGGTLPAGTPLTGTSPGTLTFQGNVALGAAALTRVNIDGALSIPGGPGTYDKIIVTGAGNTFTVAGTLLPVLRGIPGGNNNYTPAAGTVFGFLTAQNGASLTGQFTLSQPSAGLAANTRLDVIYGATAISLSVTPLNFQALAVQQNLDNNAQAIAGAIQAARPAPGVRAVTSRSNLFNDLYDNTVSADDSELNALAGEGLAANPMSVLSSFSGISNLLAAHQVSLHAPAASTRVAYGYGNAIASDVQESVGGEPDRWTVWGQGFGGWSQVGMDSAIAGAHEASSGALLGMDRAVLPDLAVGAALSFGHTGLTSGGVVAATDTYAGAGYLSWTSNGWLIDGRLAGGAVSGRTMRSVNISGVAETLTGTPGGWGVLADAEAGRRFRLSGIDLEPYAGMLLQTYRQGAYTETGEVGLDLPNQYFSRAQSALGVRLDSDFDIAGFELRPRADFAWTHDIGDQGLTTHAVFFDEPFEITAAQPGRDAARVGAGFSIAASDRVSIFADYDGEFRSNATSQQVSGGIRLAL